MKASNLIVFSLLVFVGCGKPLVSMKGVWNVQDPASGRQGIKTTTTYTDTHYSMVTNFSTPNGETAIITVKGKYEFKDGQITMNPESAEVDDSTLGEDSKAKYAAMFDKQGILASLRKNPTMSITGVSSGLATLKDVSGREIKLKKL